MQQNNLTVTTYRTGMRYKFYAGFGALATLAFGRNLVSVWLREDGVQWDAFFFLVLMLALFGWAIWQTQAKIQLSQRSVAISRPFSMTRTVEYRQLFSVTENGRVGGRSISLVYHPLREDGLLDLDDARSLILPEVEGQDELLAWIEARTPA